MSTTAQCSLSLSSLPKSLLWGLPESPPSLTLTISPRNVTFHLLPQTPNTNWSGQSFHVISHRKSFPQYTQLFFFPPLFARMSEHYYSDSVSRPEPLLIRSLSLPPFLPSCFALCLLVCCLVLLSVGLLLFSDSV